MPKWLESKRSPNHRRKFQSATAEQFLATGTLVDLVGIPETENRRPSRILVATFFQVFACFAVMGSIVGCATVRGEKYTSKNLPQNYFASARTNPQTLDLSRLAVPTSNSDIIANGDLIDATIAANLNEKDTVRLQIRISDDGSAELPEIGRLHLAGHEIPDAEALIRTECVQQGIYRNPSVTLVMKQQKTNRITVTGAVRRPAIYELPRGRSDLLSALTKAEGLDQTAGTEITIRNADSRSASGPAPVAGASQNSIDTVGHSVEVAKPTSGMIKIDLVSAIKNGTGGYLLDDGAVVHVEKRDPEPLYVIGLVTRPGKYDYPVGKDVRVTDAIALAWGVNSLAANKIFVIRRKPVDAASENVDPENPDQLDTFIIKTSLANAKQKASSNILLQPGDVVSVEQSPLTLLFSIFSRVGISSIPITGTPLF